MKEMGRIVDEIGIDAAKQQIKDFFLYREEQYKQRAIQQYEQVLAEQEAMRYRWRNHQCT